MDLSQPNSHLFCSSCGSLLDLPGQNNDWVNCQLCNQSHSCTDFEKIKVVTNARKSFFNHIKSSYDIEEEDLDGGAIIDEKCEKCQWNQLKFFTMQLRSADEGQTVFYKCVRCSYTFKLNS